MDIDERVVNRLFRIVLKCLNYVFLLGVLFSAVALLIIAAVALFCEGWYLWPVPDGFLNAIEFWRPYLPVIKIFGYSATLLLAGYNLSKYLDVMAIESLRTIRERFNSPKANQLHEFLLDSSDQVPLLSCHKESNDDKMDDIKNITVYDYLGTIELGAIMLRKGMVSIDDFYNQFGYRIENVFRNKDIANSINLEMRYYRNLIYARDLLIKKGKLKFD